MNEMKEKIINIFRKHCEFLDDDFDDKQLEELGIDSLTFIKVVVELENQFGFEFDDDDLDYKKFPHLDNVCDYINEKISDFV